MDEGTSDFSIKVERVHIMSNYKENAEYIKSFLDEVKWHYDMHNYDGMRRVLFTGGIGGSNEPYGSFHYMAIVDDNAAECYATLPASAQARLPQMSEFITRANYNLKYGAFEMDYNDGQIRFRLAFPMVALRADRALIMLLFCLPVNVLAQHFKGITEVLTDLKTPEEAIADCERQ